MGASPPAAVATTIAELLGSPTATAATKFAVERFEGLFGRRGGTGIQLAVRALREATPADRVQATSLAYTRELYVSLGELADGR